MRRVRDCKFWQNGQRHAAASTALHKQKCLPRSAPGAISRLHMFWGRSLLPACGSVPPWGHATYDIEACCNNSGYTPPCAPKLPFDFHAMNWTVLWAFLTTLGEAGNAATLPKKPHPDEVRSSMRTSLASSALYLTSGRLVHVGESGNNCSPCRKDKGVMPKRGPATPQVASILHKCADEGWRGHWCTGCCSQAPCVSGNSTCISVCTFSVQPLQLQVQPSRCRHVWDAALGEGRNILCTCDRS